MTPYVGPHPYDRAVSTGYDRLAAALPHLAAALLHLADLSRAARDALSCTPDTARTLTIFAVGIDQYDAAGFAKTLEVQPLLVITPVDLVKTRGIAADAWVASSRLLLARPALTRNRVARFLEPCTSQRRTA